MTADTKRLTIKMSSPRLFQRGRKLSHYHVETASQP